MTKYLRIDKQKPEEGQKVYYWFGAFDQVYAGWYSHVTEDDNGYDVYDYDCFYDKTGFLCNDVTYWKPRDEDNMEDGYSPNQVHPTLEQKATCIFHPVI